MPTKTFSFEEGLGTGIKFADRTKPEAPSEKILPGFNAGGEDDILGRLQSIADTHGTRITSGYRNPINYGAGKKSAHGDRRAADFRTKDMSREASDKLIEDLKARGFWVNDERDNWQAINPKTGKQRGTGPHIHAEWRGEGGSGGAGSDGAPAPQKKTFSFEDALGTRKPMAEVAPALVQPKDAPKTNHSILPEIMKGLRPDTPNSAVPSFISDPVERSLDAIGKAIRTRYQSVTGQLGIDDPDYNPAPAVLPSVSTLTRGNQFTDKDYKNDPFIENRRITARAEATKKADSLNASMGQGFWDNIRNPVDLLLSDSLPANLVEWASSSYERGFDRLMEARKVQMQESILANPEKYPAVSVDAARKATEARIAKQDRGVGDAWKDLKQAAKENPKKFGAQFVNALLADPEMVLVPQGLGLKVAAATERAAKGASVASKAAQIADRILDPALTGAGLNLAMEAAAAGSEGRELTGSDAGMAAGLGGALGGLSGVFSRGKAAADKMAAGKITEETLQDAMHSMAQAEVFLDDLKSPATFVNVKHQIERATGIKFESEKDLAAYLESERARWKKLFEERDLHGQYQEALADERISRRTVLAEEAEAKTARVAAEGEREAAVAAAYEQKAGDRIATFNSDYEKALAARDAVDMNDLHQQAVLENDLRNAEAKLTEEEILDAARSGNIPEVKRAMLKAAARDSKLRVPKWQRGEVDPKLLARLGVGGLFAGTAYAVADDNKEMGALAAGLAGLLVPGGGRVAGRMRQAGSTTVDNLFTEAAEKFLKSTKFSDEATNAQMKKDAAAIERAKAGDQKAFNELYQDHSRKLIGTIRRRIQGYAGKFGLDAEDIAMEAMTDAFINLDKYKPDAPFSAYLNQIAKNKASSAVRQGRASMRGGKFDIESASVPSMVDSFGEPTGVADAFDRGAGADMQTTPETIALAEEARDIFMRELQKLPETKRIAVLLKNAEGDSIKEIAQKLGMQETATQVMIHRAEKDLLDAIQNRKGAARAHHELAKPTGEIVKRGRGRPRKETGEIDPKLLATGAKLAGAALVGLAASQFFVDPNDAEGNPDPKKRFSPLISAVGTTALAAVAMLSKGRGTKSLAKATADAIDYAFGSSSTRILNKSEKVFGAIQSTIRRTSSETHRYIEEVNPFLKKMNSLDQTTQDIVARALYTGKASVINKILEALGDPELSRAYKSVRGTLDSLGDKLVTLKRFSKGAFEYFPRIIKDKEGLFAAIGKERSGEITKIIDDANIASLKKSGKPLTGFEENALINSILFGGDNKHIQPGWSKSRGIEEITPELLQYYATPAESLHSYIRSAVADIEKAKFFGDYARNMKVGGHEFLDTDASVGLMMREELAKGKLTDADAKEIGSILKTFFNEGSMGESSAMRTIKDTMYMGLLGNFMSTITQLADVAVPIYTQDLRSTIAAVVRQATGNNLITARQLGLIDNISQEFASQSRSTRALNKLLKGTLFSQIDQIGKNVSLNAAVIRAQRLAKSENGSGVTTLSKKYQEILGDRFNTLISDLKSGKISDVVQDYAWMELTRTQPISMLEQPQLYMKHPNFRSYLMLKSFVIKQIDLVRRDAIQNIASKDPAKVTKGIKNLAEMTIVMGTAGMGTQAVKDWLQGKDVKLELSDIPFNLVKNLGWSEYQIDKLKGVTKEEAARRREANEPNARAQEAAPLKATLEFVVPPYDMFDQIAKGDPAALRYLVPGVGPQIAQWAKDSMTLEQEVNANE